MLKYIGKEAKYQHAIISLEESKINSLDFAMNRDSIKKIQYLNGEFKL